MPDGTGGGDGEKTERERIKIPLLSAIISNGMIIFVGLTK